ncbi:putative colanic acid biosynthesis acetyltransferase [Bradyrhizobium sp. BRP20]|uniref:putative colanic acid biosynthesis acetyltransferase n=1 Tax=unclassified Bradyrhizobium TaxID=2631580 RepID=UPI001CD6F767|nr:MULTISPECIES: putative colanic acid biosynthesis acetyltransferase [unclassified Bradyrhizobium]MCA1392267.1 putative colanic acid biosynthesis acetyltransferase [Bradyrhizobium sp. IC3123]MCA1433528.1 putative colanic acid biosynthesis acetyltransferase [Bradyrhizobium sp. BRP20]
MAIIDAKISKPLDGGASFSLSNRLQRAMWNVTWLLLASWTPAPMHGWRRALLRLFGAKMGARTDVRGSARVWYPPHLTMEERCILAEGVNCYNMAPITIRSGTIISQRAHLCAGGHDIDDPNFQLVAQPIVIERNCWVAAEAFVGPGVRMGEGAVLGARGVTFKDLEPQMVYVGNPAMPKRARGGRGDLES